MLKIFAALFDDSRRRPKIARRRRVACANGTAGCHGSGRPDACEKCRTAAEAEQA